MKVIETVKDATACCSLTDGFLASKKELDLVTLPSHNSTKLKANVDFIFSGNLLYPHQIHICIISTDGTVIYLDSSLKFIQSIDLSSPLAKSVVLLDAQIYTFEDRQRIAVLSLDSVSVLDGGRMVERMSLPYSLVSLSSIFIYHCDLYMFSVCRSVVACSTADLSSVWIKILEDDPLVMIPYHSDTLAITESFLYVLNADGIKTQFSMCHGIPSCAIVNPLNENVVLVGSHDCCVLIFNSMSLDWIIKTTSVPRSIAISSYGYVLA